MIKFVFWDVQHGHATYLQTPTKHIVFDLGTGSYGSEKEFSPLRHLKNKWGVKQLDGVIITHPHTDHLDDIFAFAELSPKVIRRPKHLTDKDIYQANRNEDKEVVSKYLEISSLYSSAVGSGENPFSAENNGGVTIKSFTPQSCSTSNLNNHSVVTVVSYESCKLLIPGDNEPSSWDELLGDESFITEIKGTDVLLAPHHGRKSGFSSSLFEHISPCLTVISDGRFCDTSATGRYSEKTKGWNVHKRSGKDEERKCVTTRNDGVIVVKLGRNDNGNRFIDVTID